MERQPGLHFSVSCTTRPPRREEADGRDYRFVSTEEFERKRQAGQFLELAEVHGCYYGTLREELEPWLEGGHDVLMDIDVEGARQVRRNLSTTKFARSMVYVFFGPPSLAEIERRLRGRGTEDEHVLARRLNNAKEELRAWREYDYLIVNDQLDQALHDLQSVYQAARRLTVRYVQPPWEV